MGQFDGSHPLPLAEGGVLDFRPAVQSAMALLGQGRPYPPGPWDEALVWLGGDESAEDGPGVPVGDAALGDGGVYVMRSGAGRAVGRAAAFRHRPSHADQLHVDLWRHGRPVALDAGTFSYNAPPPWSQPPRRHRGPQHGDHRRARPDAPGEPLPVAAVVPRPR